MDLTQHETNEATIQKNEVETPVSLEERYRFIQRLGKGAQGEVFLAERREDGLNVTVKQLNIGSVKTWKEYELFQREADVLAKLDMDGIAKFYEAIECLDDNPPCSYIVQEYIQGESMAKYLARGHRFDVDQIYDILIQMLKILAQLHRLEPPVIHRDIKPSNIMLTPVRSRFRVTLIDFGAVSNPQIQSGGSTIAGTFGYMPPEQLMGKPVPASDIYALAAVAVELFSYKSPATMPIKDFRLIFEPYMEHMPLELHSTLRKMLSPNVEDRLQDTSKIIEIFGHYMLDDYGMKQDVGEAEIDKLVLKKMRAVESIFEFGNMEIWESLPDQTPRELPPELHNYIVNKSWRNNDVLYALRQQMDLFANGRKSIATIVSYEYLATEKKDIQDHQEMFRIGKVSSPMVQLTVNSDPTFKIYYKFNPPDDSRYVDLIHSCLVHAEPNVDFKVGDAIPILYLLDKSPHYENVVSIPFPFPFKNLDEDFETLMHQSYVSASYLSEFNQYVKPIYDTVQNIDKHLSLDVNVETIIKETLIDRIDACRFKLHNPDVILNFFTIAPQIFNVDLNKQYRFLNFQIKETLISTLSSLFHRYNRDDIIFQYINLAPIVLNITLEGISFDSKFKLIKTFLTVFESLYDNQTCNNKLEEHIINFLSQSPITEVHQPSMAALCSFDISKLSQKVCASITYVYQRESTAASIKQSFKTDFVFSKPLAKYIIGIPSLSDLHVKAVKSCIDMLSSSKHQPYLIPCITQLISLYNDNTPDVVRVFVESPNSREFPEPLWGNLIELYILATYPKSQIKDEEVKKRIIEVMTTCDIHPPKSILMNILSQPLLHSINIKNEIIYLLSEAIHVDISNGRFNNNVETKDKMHIALKISQMKQYQSLYDIATHYIKKIIYQIIDAESLNDLCTYIAQHTDVFNNNSLRDMLFDFDYKSSNNTLASFPVKLAIALVSDPDVAELDINNNIEKIFNSFTNSPDLVRLKAELGLWMLFMNKYKSLHPNAIRSVSAFLNHYYNTDDYHCQNFVFGFIANHTSIINNHPFMDMLLSHPCANKYDISFWVQTVQTYLDTKDTKFKKDYESITLNPPMEIANHIVFNKDFVPNKDFSNLSLYPMTYVKVLSDSIAPKTSLIQTVFSITTLIDYFVTHQSKHDFNQEAFLYFLRMLHQKCYNCDIKLPFVTWINYSKLFHLIQHKEYEQYYLEFFHPLPTQTDIQNADRSDLEKIEFLLSKKKKGSDDDVMIRWQSLGNIRPI